MATTVEKMMQLDIVDASNANAGWKRQDNQSGYGGIYNFTNGVHPHSLMVFKTVVPKNLAGTPAWNLVIEHAGQQAGAVLLRVEAVVLGSGDTPPARTVIVPNNLIGVDASGDHNITVLSGTNFDSLLAIGASKLLKVFVMRSPNGASGDTAGANWGLVTPPVLRCDVT